MHRGAFGTDVSQVVLLVGEFDPNYNRPNIKLHVQKCQGLQFVEISFSGLSLQVFRCERRRLRSPLWTKSSRLKFSAWHLTTISRGSSMLIVCVVNWKAVSRYCAELAPSLHKKAPCIITMLVFTASLFIVLAPGHLLPDTTPSSPSRADTCCSYNSRRWLFYTFCCPFF